jgi:signal transduction histidine kinase
MGRHLRAATVLLADTALLAATHPRPAAVAAYALAVALVLAASYRWAVPALVAALALAALTGGGWVLLLWAAYHAGRAARTRVDAAVILGAVLGAEAVQLARAPVAPRTLTNLVVTGAVFVALPLLVGRYLAQHERLLAALADEERLRERLRIARDMHDSLGRRLSLIALQAPAGPLGAAARDAIDELHEVVAALRADDPGIAAVPALVTQFHTAGVPATVRETGARRPLPAAAAHAAYRTVEEGLTNATKHAPGRPVAVHLTWESDALLVTVTNPLSGEAAGEGHGLTGLDERVRAAGGALDHRARDGEYRLTAMLPLAEHPAPVRTVGIGFAIAALMFVLLPAAMLLGAG